MKRSFILLAACGLTAAILPSCKEKTASKPGANRAPQLVKQPVTKAPVHPEIRALEQDMKRGKDSYDTVRQRMFSLPRELSRDDANALLNLLLAPPDDSWTELGWAAIVNDGFNILREGKNQPENFMARLIALHRDEARPTVLRDYALQHFGTQLAAYYRDPAGTGKRLYPDANMRQEAESSLRAALASSAGSMTGTACNVADDILTAVQASGSTPPVSRDELDRACKTTALAPNGNLHARISALGILGRHRSPSALKEARSWMLDAGQPALLRAAAINYTGQFALETDRPTFNTLAADTDLRLALPAKESLKHLGQP